MSSRYEAPPGLIDKRSNDPLAQLLLGQVIAVLWLESNLLLFYQDGRKAEFSVDDDGNLVIAPVELRES